MGEVDTLKEKTCVDGKGGGLKGKMCGDVVMEMVGGGREQGWCQISRKRSRLSQNMGKENIDGCHFVET